MKELIEKRLQNLEEENAYMDKQWAKVVSSEKEDIEERMNKNDLLIEELKSLLTFDAAGDKVVDCVKPLNIPNREGLTHEWKADICFGDDVIYIDQSIEGEETIVNIAVSDIPVFISWLQQFTSSHPVVDFEKLEEAASEYASGEFDPGRKGEWPKSKDPWTFAYDSFITGANYLKSHLQRGDKVKQLEEELGVLKIHCEHIERTLAQANEYIETREIEFYNLSQELETLKSK